MPRRCKSTVTPARYSRVAVGRSRVPIVAAKFFCTVTVRTAGIHLNLLMKAVVKA